MEKKFFKLVETTEADVKGKPFVVTWESGQVTANPLSTPKPSPDFVLNVMEGSAAVFNLREALS